MVGNAVLSTGAVSCWGSSLSGGLGTWTHQPTIEPSLNGSGQQAISISAGTAKKDTFSKGPVPEHIAGVGAYDKYSKFYETTGYDFFKKQPAMEAGFPDTQSDGPTYGGVFSRLFMGPEGDNLFDCGRYKYGSSCWKISCGS